MPADRLLVLLDAISTAGIRIWLDGGWGVAALLGQQHRPHADADLVVPLEDVDRLTQALNPYDFAVAEDKLPTRMVLRSRDGEQVDLHPVTFDAEGHGWQARAAPNGSDCLYPADQFTHGLINGRNVPCVGASAQVDHHTGYSPRPHDVDDMLRLTSRFGLTMPVHYPST